MLNAVLGGSVSSRLFQCIREEHGLAYNVYSALETYADAGCFWIYAGTRPDAAATVLDLIIEELGVLRELPVSDEELSRMKENLKGSVMLGLESTVGRMSTLAQQETYFGRTFDMDEILAGIDEVDVKQIQELAQRVFADEGIAVDMLARRSVGRRARRPFRRRAHPCPPVAAWPRRRGAIRRRFRRVRWRPANSLVVAGEFGRLEVSG